MGYNTEFKGVLKFKHDPTVGQIKKLKTYFGEDCRDHPEWVEAKGMTYIDYRVTQDMDGIEWDDNTEKSYEMVEKLNFVINEMRKEYPNFDLEGELFAQGEDIGDVWYLRMVDGQAMEVPIDFDRSKIVCCPDCGHEFIPE